MHTDEQVFKAADKTVELLYELNDYDTGKSVDVFVTLEKDGQTFDYLAVYTKTLLGKNAAWVHSHVKK
ncbi:hypothetical protein [Mucilaginibacter phyllosphaerae]|uniref:Uncharacterized protein n=1 Tax=Mucilaginibacter phyllosphaerae TaxID=1812349 RepID=A0A4Y8AKJ3_9SPHI|nr:hypothetical protein [Mucilaginibacter phyllosphaerae]MBB3967915.1 hypothetical protein [Mucilaginibacter phyllosphaerae]TEW69045.1 hypothetical protein E2R65_02455 [Mucilaginibacter phyllosphaerae]GGH02447.1 hypothetical protein GCM10007352_04690 [Mucilaginibacter phyllosphaerae]